MTHYWPRVMHVASTKHTDFHNDKVNTQKYEATCKYNMQIRIQNTTYSKKVGIPKSKVVKRLTQLLIKSILQLFIQL